MKTSWYLAEQIVSALRKAVTRMSVPWECRKKSMSGRSFFLWKKKDIGIGVVQVGKESMIWQARVSYVTNECTTASKGRLESDTSRFTDYTNRKILQCVRRDRRGMLLLASDWSEN